MPRTSYTLTGSQTVGPFFHDCLLRDGADCPVLVTPTTAGERIRIVGRVIDGDGLGVPDAMIEIWQANAAGRYNHPADTRDLPLDPSFTGYGRTGTDADGTFQFETIKPGAVPFDDQRLQAPHIGVTVFARGLLNHLCTRLYFADEPANAADPILLLVPAERRATLIATSLQEGTTPVYRLDIVLQGAGETVFFNLVP
jgi:protocatechuate 3,4-dioxygenase alpha subunit